MTIGGIQEKARSRDILKFVKAWRGLTDDQKIGIAKELCAGVIVVAQKDNPDTELNIPVEWRLAVALNVLATEPHKFNIALESQLSKPLNMVDFAGKVCGVEA